MDFYQSQVFTLKNTPGVPPADAEFAEKWLLNVRIRETRRVKEMVQEIRQQNEQKLKDAAERINSLQDDLVRVRKQSERNEVPYSELTKQTRLLSQARAQLERVHGSVTASEQRASVMENEPLAYLEDWYNRFPALRDRRPNLAAALAEDREKRGLRL